MPRKVGTQDIGRRLAWARGQRGLSQGAVARLAGIAPSYLSRIETGKVHPTFRMVQKIAASFKVHLQDLVAGPSAPTDDGCPISRTGACMLDLVQSDARLDRIVKPGAYSIREIRLLQLLGRWMENVGDDRLRAMEVLLHDLLGSEGRRGRKSGKKRTVRRG